MAVKLEYALKDAKGKTIVIPKEKIVEELYHQRISFSFEKTKFKIQNYEKSTKEDTDEFLQKEIQSMTEQVADDFYNACLHTYMNKYYSTILKIQDYQHEHEQEQEQKEYRIPSEPPKDLETKLKKGTAGNQSRNISKVNGCSESCEYFCTKRKHSETISGTGTEKTTKLYRR